MNLSKLAFSAFVIVSLMSLRGFAPQIARADGVNPLACSPPQCYTSVSVTASGSNFAPIFETKTGTGSMELSAFSSDGSVMVAAVTQPGKVGVNIESTVVPPVPGNEDFAGASAAFAISDIMITGPAPSVSASMFDLVSGFVSVKGGGIGSSAGNILLATIELTSPNGFIGEFEICQGANFPASPVECFPPVHVVPNDISEVAQTPNFNLPTGVPIRLNMVLQAQSVAVGEGSSSVFWADTFGLPPSGPVFDLPAGYTANSVQGDIVDNRWLGAGTTSAVPEPSSLLLLATGLLGVIGAGRRKLLW